MKEAVATPDPGEFTQSDLTAINLESMDRRLVGWVGDGSGAIGA